MNKEELNVFIIPPNFTDGIVIAGKVISLRCFVQALIIAVIPTAAVFSLYDPDSLTAGISVCISVFIPLFIFSAAGILGNGVIDFLIIMLHCVRKRRKCFYNPRIKQEEQLAFPIEQQGRVINGKRIMDLLKRKSAGKANDEIPDEDLFFEDDIRIRETPIEYMNLFQYWRHRLGKRKKEVRIYED